MQIIERIPTSNGTIVYCKQEHAGRLQVSYNSDKRIVLRLIMDEKGAKDILICLNEEETKILAKSMRYFIIC